MATIRVHGKVQGLPDTAMALVELLLPRPSGHFVASASVVTGAAPQFVLVGDEEAHLVVGMVGQLAAFVRLTVPTRESPFAFTSDPIEIGDSCCAHGELQCEIAMPPTPPNLPVFVPSVSSGVGGQQGQDSAFVSSHSAPTIVPMPYGSLPRTVVCRAVGQPRIFILVPQRPNGQAAEVVIAGPCPDNRATG